MSKHIVQKVKRSVPVRYFQISEGRRCEEEEKRKSVPETWSRWAGFISVWCDKEDCWDNVAMWQAWSYQGFKVRCGRPSHVQWPATKKVRNSLVRVLGFLMLQSQYQDPLLEFTLSAAAWQPHPLAPRFHLPQARLGVIILSLVSSLKVTDATTSLISFQSFKVLHWNPISISYICYFADVDNGCIVSMQLFNVHPMEWKVKIGSVVWTCTCMKWVTLICCFLFFF